MTEKAVTEARAGQWAPLRAQLRVGHQSPPGARRVSPWVTSAPLQAGRAVQAEQGFGHSCETRGNCIRGHLRLAEDGYWQRGTTKGWNSHLSVKVGVGSGSLMHSNRAGERRGDSLQEEKAQVG